MTELTSEDYFYCNYFNRIGNSTDVKVIVYTTRSRPGDSFSLSKTDKTGQDRGHREHRFHTKRDIGDTGAQGTQGPQVPPETPGHRGYGPLNINGRCPY